MASLIECLRKALPMITLLVFGLIETVFSGRLQVHMVLNSHIDLGWVNTIDEYFYGRGTRYGENVNSLFSGVFDALSRDKSRTYCMSELGFLDIWWQQQSQDNKDRVIKLFQEGQIEIVNGGMVGNDEATAMYDDIIENFISGQRWAKKNLNGTNSTVGFQMDSFGTSVAQAYLLKEAGYEGTYFSRVDNEERQRRKESASLDFDWVFPNDQGSMFTHLMSRTYYLPVLPRALWISMLFGGNFSPSDYEELVRQLRKDRTFVRTDNVILLFSGDFYPSYGASGVYGPMDDIVRYFKNHPELEIDVFYSNPGKYVKAVKKDLEAGSIDLDNKNGDFFPLNEQPGTLWTGYYTTKSAFKAFVRWHSRYLTATKLFVSQRAMKQFNTSNATEYAALNSAFTELEKALSLVQHHDGVSGTMKEHVRFDYEDILTRARRSLEDKLTEILTEELKEGQAQEAVVLSLKSTYDNLLEEKASPEISKSSLPADSDLLLAVMNPGNKRLSLITANTTSTLTNDNCVTIETSDSRTISPDIICQESGSTKCTIYFTDTIEAYAWMYYQIKITDKGIGTEQCGEILNSEDASSGKQVEGSYWTLKIDDGNAFTFLKTEGSNTLHKQFKLSYSYYESALANRGTHNASGAYLFMPRNPLKLSLSTENKTVLWTGKHIALVQIQSDKFTTTLQLLLEQEQTGFSVITQLAPVTDAPNGCEIVMEVTVPDLQADGKFFTDTNGIFMLERPYVLASSRERPEDEVSKNYHPITTRCSLEGNSGTEAFTIFTDRAQGASIQRDNQINVMIHRVAVVDDDEGVDEILNEKDRNTNQPLAITTWHYFLWSDISTPHQAERQETQYDTERPLRVWLFSVNNAFSVNSTVQKVYPISELPRSLKLSLRTYSQNDHSIRLHNLDPKNSLSVTLSGISNASPSLISYLSQNNLTGLTNITETYWTTTQVKEDSSNFDLKRTVKIDLAPLQMRTYQISVGQLDESQMIPGEETGTTNPIPGNTSTSVNTTNTTQNNATNSANVTNITNTTPNNTANHTTPSSSSNTTNTTNTNPQSNNTVSHNTTNPSPINMTHNVPNKTTNVPPNNTANASHNNTDNTKNTTSNTSDNTTSTTGPDLSTGTPKENKPESHEPQVEETVSTGSQNSPTMLLLGSYLILHICVGIIYFFRCYLTAKKRNIPLDTFRRDILVVASLGPIGFAVVWCLKRKDEEEQVVKHEIITEESSQVEQMDV